MKALILDASLTACVGLLTPRSHHTERAQASAAVVVLAHLLETLGA
jgi:hypothetical protein